MRLSSCHPSATLCEILSLISTSTSCQLTSSLSKLSAPLASISACTQGFGCFTHSAKARWVTRVNFSTVARFFFRYSALTITELPYGFRPTSRQARKPMSSPSSFLNTWCRL